MNITLLTNRDLASNLALNYLYRGLPARHTLRVLLSARVGKTGPKPSALCDLTFAEQTLFNELIFPALSSRQGPLKARLLSFEDFKQLGIAVDDIGSINCEKGLQILRESQPELMISIRFGLILKQTALTVAKHGVLNLHSGKLPDYRGVMACFRAMKNKDVEHSSTLHFINDGTIDTGDVVAYNTLPLNYHASYLENVLALYPGGVTQILEAIAAIEDKGHIPRYPQIEPGHYYSFPTQPEIDDFLGQNLRFFDYDLISRITQQYL